MQACKTCGNPVITEGRKTLICLDCLVLALVKAGVIEISAPPAAPPVATTAATPAAPAAGDDTTPPPATTPPPPW